MDSLDHDEQEDEEEEEEYDESQLRSVDELGRALLSIEIRRTGEVNEFAVFFAALTALYNYLVLVDAKLQAAPGQAHFIQRLSRFENWESLGSHVEAVYEPPSLRQFRFRTRDADRLQLLRIEVSSPGLITLRGRLDPLESIRKYLQDRHKRRQDIEYREAAEAAMLNSRVAEQRIKNEEREMKVEILKTKVLKEKISILKKLGMSDEEIMEKLVTPSVKHFEALGEFEDTRLIGGAS